MTVIKLSDYQMGGSFVRLFAKAAGKKMTTDMFWTNVVNYADRKAYGFVALARKDGTWDAFRKDVKDFPAHELAFGGRSVRHYTAHEENVTLALGGVSEVQVKSLFKEHSANISKSDVEKKAQKNLKGPTR
jgi:hypothetical protein